jgi:hypothetical protein
MSDSRCHDELTSGDLVGGRDFGRRDRAGSPAHVRRGLPVCAIAALAMSALLGLGVNAGAQATAPTAPAQGRAERAAPPQGAAADGVPAAGPTQSLSSRYRFIESYGLHRDLERPESVIEYKVGSIETFRKETEKARGAPERQELEYRTIYTERAALLGRRGEVTDAVRRYETFRAGGLAQSDPRMAGLLQGLTLWYHLRPGGLPELISQTPNRPIRQKEYEMAADQLFFPRLSAIFPPQAVRKSDSWPLTRAAAQALLGQFADTVDFQLDASLTQIEKAGEGTELAAIIDIEGTLNLEDGDGAVRARIWFVFEPVPAPSTAPKRRSDRPASDAVSNNADVIEARGYISKVHMTRRKATPLDEDGRLQEIVTRELQVQRRKVTDEQLDIAQKPAANEQNSWPLLDDPQGRFHLRHPQELEIVDLAPGDDLEMIHRGANGSMDTLLVALVKDAVKDRRLSDPQYFVRELKDQWSRNGYDIVEGESGWLPDQDWAPLKRRVYRVETAIKPEAQAAAVRRAARIYLDGYLVIFSRGDVFWIRALTDRDDHVVFRAQAEGLIRSLELGPSPGAAVVSAQPAPTRPAATPPSTGRPAASTPSDLPARPAASTPSDLPAPPPVPRSNRRP